MIWNRKIQTGNSTFSFHRVRRGSVRSPLSCLHGLVMPKKLKNNHLSFISQSPIAYRQQKPRLVTGSGNFMIFFKKKLKIKFSVNLGLFDAFLPSSDYSYSSKIWTVWIFEETLKSKKQFSTFVIGPLYTLSIIWP